MDCQTCSNHAGNPVNDAGRCTVCQDRFDKEKARKVRANLRRKERNQLMRDCGLKPGKTSDGRTIWE